MLTSISEEDRKICELQNGFAARLRTSPYYILESKKSDGTNPVTFSSLALLITPPELPRYSDKYRPSLASQPLLKRKDLHQPFFPSEIFDDYFNPKRRRKGE